MNNFSWHPAVAAVCGLAASAHATVTNLVLYHLGEADSGAAVSGPADATTTDSAGSNNLFLSGSATYTAGLGGSSTLAVHFAGNGSYEGNPASILPASSSLDNFGAEAYVQIDGTVGFQGQPIFDVAGINAHEGIALFVLPDGNYGGSVTFNSLASAFDSGVAAVPGVAADVAVVRDNGDVRMYVNGQVHDFGSQAGADTDIAGPQFPQVWSPLDVTSGTVDEARVFDFASGQFNPATDLYTAPEPTSLALVAIASMGLIARRRRT